MSANQDNVVDLGSSDDEATNTRSAEPALRPVSSSPTSTQPNNQTIQFQSFWRAGDFDVCTTKSIHEQGQLEHARVHPKFLHSNATSHKWAFGAIAELLDNAVDEICKGATYLKLDKISTARYHTPALLFQDNGGGMDPGSMRQCMSLGYSKKKGNTIGQYGNGFKTSTMRLGADVIVFSRTTRGSATQSIGLLSYTFLRKTGQDDVVVPMIDFELSGDRTQPIIYSSLDDWSNNLKTILEWSPFASEQELMQQFEDIGPQGTKVIVYNLWLNDEGLLELDFDSDEEDIRLRDEVNREKTKKKYHDSLIESHISYHIRFSLRSYASILYLRKFENFEIILRGKPVQQYNILDDMKFLEVVMYRPKVGNCSKEISVKTEIGFIKEAPLLIVSGFNVYHKNRLIRPFWKVSHEGDSRGNGVVGILEANFIEPAHDKQDFERSALFLRLETRLKQMSHDYWRSHGHLIGVGNIRPRPKKGPGPIRRSDESAASLREEFASVEPVIGLSANMKQGMHIDQPVIGLAANLRTSSNGQTVFDPTSKTYKDLYSVQPIIALAADSHIQENASCVRDLGEGSGHSDSPTVVEQICEENIQLFMRCEEHRKKETNLKQTVEELEKELAETKRKCSELSTYLETQRKLKNNRLQNGKA